MDRTQRSEQTYARLFGPRDTTAPDLDPEFGAILRRLIFGEVFHTGDLDERTRELITVTVLTTMQTLPQLKAHTGAALNVGVTPVQLREAVDAQKLIGQATGIMMERHRLTATVAFELLKVASQNRNIKLREIAQRVIETGQEPDRA